MRLLQEEPVQLHRSAAHQWSQNLTAQIAVSTLVTTTANSIHKDPVLQCYSNTPFTKHLPNTSLGLQQACLLGFRYLLIWCACGGLQSTPKKQRRTVSKAPMPSTQ
jgi:hypothetical protein